MTRAVVVGLGRVEPDLVTGVLGDDIDFVAEPTEDDLAVAEGAIVRADAVVDAAFLDRTPRMRVLARTGVGTDLVDLDAAAARGIAVVVTPGTGTRAVAEGVLAHTLALVKRVAPLTALVSGGRWADRDSSGPIGDLDGATIGIIGYGRIGRRVGELSAAFGMRVLAYDLYAPPPAEVACDDLDAALAALESGQISGVGLDVFEIEPPVHHPVFDHPSVSLTPHLMGLTRKATAATFADAAQGVVDVLAGRRPAAVANPTPESASR